MLAPAVNAQEKTPASAYEFIRQNVTDGSWEGEFEQCYSNDEDCDYKSGPIQYVTYQNSTYCHLRFSIKGINNFPTREIDLTKSFSIQEGSVRGYGIYFVGPVRSTNGKILQMWPLFPPSGEIGRRVQAAFEYLQSVCKPASAW